MAGNEQAFCDALDLASIPNDMFIYYEIGIGNGDTIEAVHSWLSQRGYATKDIPNMHHIVGVDTPDYAGPARQWIQRAEIDLNFSGSEVFLANVSRLANFIFIDACHGAACVTRDFLLAEKKIKPGGVICFHDTDQQCQGNHFQAHCGTGIDARRAVQELGLLDDTRPGWRKVNETWGDKQKAGHGALFIQRSN